MMNVGGRFRPRGGSKRSPAGKGPRPADELTSSKEAILGSWFDRSPTVSRRE